jgi:hypothetical protein
MFTGLGIDLIRPALDGLEPDPAESVDRHAGQRLSVAADKAQAAPWGQERSS